MESQLNPNAAEFVPVYGGAVEPDISSSPQKGMERSLEDISIPNANDFFKEICKRPSDIGENETSFNGDAISNISTKAVFGDDSLCLNSTVDSLASCELKDTNPFGSSLVSTFVKDHFSIPDNGSQNQFTLPDIDFKPSALDTSSETKDNESSINDVSEITFGDGFIVGQIIRLRQDSPLLRESPEPGLGPENENDVDVSPEEQTDKIPEFPSKQESAAELETIPSSTTGFADRVTIHQGPETSVDSDPEQDDILVCPVKKDQNGIENDHKNEQPNSAENGNEIIIQVQKGFISNDKEPNELDLEEEIIYHGKEEDLFIENDEDICYHEQRTIKETNEVDDSEVVIGNSSINDNNLVEETMQNELELQSEAPVQFDDGISTEKITVSITVPQSPKTLSASDEKLNVDADIKEGKIESCVFEANNELADPSSELGHSDVPEPSIEQIYSNVTEPSLELKQSADPEQNTEITYCDFPVYGLELERDVPDPISKLKNVSEQSVEINHDLLPELNVEMSHDDVPNSRVELTDTVPEPSMDISHSDMPEPNAELIDVDIPEPSSAAIHCVISEPCEEFHNELPEPKSAVSSPIESNLELAHDQTLEPKEEVITSEIEKDLLSDEKEYQDDIQSYFHSKEHISAESTVEEIKSSEDISIKQSFPIGEEHATSAIFAESIEDTFDNKMPIKEDIFVKEEVHEELICPMKLSPLTREEKKDMFEIENKIADKEEDTKSESLINNELNVNIIDHVEELLIPQEKEELGVSDDVCFMKQNVDLVCPLKSKEETPYSEEKIHVPIELPSSVQENLHSYEFDIKETTYIEANGKHEDYFLIKENHENEIENSIVFNHHNEKESVDLVCPLRKTPEEEEIIQPESEDVLQNSPLDEMSSSMIDHGEEKTLPEAQSNQLDLVQELQFEIQEKQTEADTESDSGFEIINASEASTVEMEMRYQSEKEAGAINEKLLLDRNEADSLGKPEELPNKEFESNVIINDVLERTQLEELIMPQKEVNQTEPLLQLVGDPLDRSTDVEPLETSEMVNGTATPPATPPATPAPGLNEESKEGLIAAAVAAAGVAAATTVAAVAAKADSPTSKSREPSKAVSKGAITKAMPKAPTSRPPTSSSKPPTPSSKSPAKPTSPTARTTTASKTSSLSAKAGTPTSKVGSKPSSKPSTPTGAKPAAAKSKPVPSTTAKPAVLKTTTAKLTAAKPAASTLTKSPTSKPAAPKPAAKPLANKPAAPKPAPSAVTKAPTTASKPIPAKSTASSAAPAKTTSAATNKPLSKPAPAKTTSATKPPTSATRPSATTTKPPTGTTKPPSSTTLGSKLAAKPPVKAVPAKASAPPAPLNKKPAAPTAIKKPAPTDKSTKEASNKLTAKTALNKKIEEKKVISKKEVIGEKEESPAQVAIVTTTNGHISLIENGIPSSEIVAEAN